MIGSLLVASCSPGDDSDAESKELRPLGNTLCGAEIPTAGLKKMYPGPYVGVKMMPSEGGGIDEVGDGDENREGDCDIWLTQKKGDVFTVVKVYARVVPRSSVDDIFGRFKRLYSSSRKREFSLGSAKGFTMEGRAVLAFECRDAEKGASKGDTLGASVQVLMPDHRSLSDVSRPKLSEGAAELSADTARYVSSTVLQCSSPGVPDGAPVPEAPAEP